jgi:hypothetical protein
MSNMSDSVSTEVHRVRVYFKDGVFVPEHPIDLFEGMVGEVEIDAGQVPEPPRENFPPGHPLRHLGRISDAEATEMRRIIERAFGQIDPEDWK